MCLGELHIHQVTGDDNQVRLQCVDTVDNILDESLVDQSSDMDIAQLCNRVGSCQILDLDTHLFQLHRACIVCCLGTHPECQSQRTDIQPLFKKLPALRLHRYPQHPYSEDVIKHCGTKEQKEYANRQGEQKIEPVGSIAEVACQHIAEDTQVIEHQKKTKIVLDLITQVQMRDQTSADIDTDEGEYPQKNDNKR